MGTHDVKGLSEGNERRVFIRSVLNDLRALEMMNLDPVEFGGDCSSGMERRLNELLAKAGTLAREAGVEIVLTGILPTLRHSDLGLDEPIESMRHNGISCLPVVKGDRLVGLITERDLMDVAAELLEEPLKP